MQSYPHHYMVTGKISSDSDVQLLADGLSEIPSAPPKEFGGPGDKWSPESLLVAAVADCFILTFKSIASVSRLSWKTLNCEVEGTLDKSEKITKFTAFQINAVLEVEPGVKQELAEKLLQKAEHSCLITNSLSSEIYLNSEIKEG